MANLSGAALDRSSAATARRRASYAMAALVLADALLILAAFSIAYVLRYNVSWPPPFNRIVREVLAVNYTEPRLYVPYALLMMVVLLIQFAIKGLYRLPRNAGLLDYAGKIISSTTTGVALVVSPETGRVMTGAPGGVVSTLKCTGCEGIEV